MRILIIYGSTEGQTRKIARYATDVLVELDHTVELLDASNAQDVPVGDFDAIIIAASLHMGRYQTSVTHFATENAATLNLAKTLFLSVSLAAAGEVAEEDDELGQCDSAFLSQTGWTPGAIVHVAGAFRFTQYDFLKTWAMRYIASKHDIAVEKGQDLELTDWDELRSELISFASG